AGSLIFIQDETAGIFVDVPVSAKGRYHVGEYGDLAGYTAPGLFAPQVVPASFTVLGVTPLPPAHVAPFDELSTGKLDSQRVEIAGIIRAVLPDPRPDLRRTVTLKMSSDDGVFPVTVSDLPPERLASVVDASVRVRGVLGGAFNERRQMIGIKLYVGRPDDLIVEEAGRPEAYGVPATPVANLLRFQPEGQNRHRVRVVGTVTLIHPGVELYLEDGTGGVAVRTRQMDAPAVGDRVEVLGFPEMGDWTPYLDDAVFRRDGASPSAVVPIFATADQELSAGAHDSRLVSVEAELVDVVADAGRLLLVAKSKNILFDGELASDNGGAGGGGVPATATGAPGTTAGGAAAAGNGSAAAFLSSLAHLRNGSRIRLTGISMVGLGADREHPSHFRLLLRSLDDIAVLQKPPWLTLGRLIWILVALALFTVVALTWGVVLRRRVNSQTATIRQQLHNETKLEQRYRELFDNAYDVIYTHDRSGRLLTVNRAAEAITGYRREELLQRTVFDLTPLEQHGVVSAWLNRAANGQQIRPTFATELVTKDGRFVPVEISVRPLMDGDRIKAIEGVARDITERKRAETELAVAHKRLVETSRRAGMAEVAAGVLHNVGNVLSSVTASATHLAGQLRGSRLPQLAAVAEEVHKHAADLGRFLAEEPRGRALPQELSELAVHLTGEHAAIAHEVESLGRSVEHIEEIVAMQQGYARVSGMRENVAAQTLIEDALRIHRQALERHNITVTREFSKAPLLLVEKHKVLEILVNLLSNAKYACVGTAPGASARITVRVDTPKGERAGDRVRIVVADNGMGISHENLVRIFDHGFTTREGGHGVGLHSASTTARELGGALFVHSDGPGKGARFTLDLPVRPPSDGEGESRPYPEGYGPSNLAATIRTTARGGN
ncbi:MAG: PAS domain S-box protein, partial [Polyangia bacterium]